MNPLISVIIPVGPRHVQHCRVAAASVARSSVGHLCETIVVPDGGAQVAPMPGVRVLPAALERQGPARTRNRGIEVARAPFACFLDADDYLLPHGLEHMARRYAAGGCGYVYGNTYTQEPDHQVEAMRGRADVRILDTPTGPAAYVLRSAPDYTQEELRLRNLHVVTALVPTKHVRAVGGFDEAIDAWEDWTLWLRLGIAGICGVRVPVPVFTYRVYEGDRMQRFYSGDPALMHAVLNRYRNERGEIPMAGCCGGDAALQQVARSIADQGRGDTDPLDVGSGMVRIEYSGPERGSFSLTPPGYGEVRLGNNAIDKYKNVPQNVADWLLARFEPSDLRVVPNFDAPGPAPEPLPVADVVAEGTEAESVAPNPPARVSKRTQKLEPA